MSVLAVATRPTDGETDDRVLVAGVRAGDDRAFEQLFARYQPRITAYVRGMVRDEGRAEDVTQEVFMAALRRMREEPERDIHFKPWIYEIAKNRCIDAFRRTRYTSEISLDADDAIRAEEQGRLAELRGAPDSAVEGKIAMDNLRGAFGGLAPEQHEILVLREFDGLSYREIGERLGMSRPAVESALFRARKRLSEEYEELVSGERCLRVQRLLDAHGGQPPGLRDKRRMARHLSHCQPCRRHACRAGVDLGAVARTPAGAAEKIAAFLPLPAFLRRRWGDDAVGAPLLGHGGSISHWSANAATVLDPSVVSSWTKAVATAATVAVAGMGASAAITERAPFGSSGGGAESTRSAPAPSGAGPDAAGRERRDGAGAAGTAKRGGNETAAPASRAGAGADASIGPSSRAPAAAPPRAERGARREFDSDGSASPAAGGAAPAKRGEPSIARPGVTLDRILGGVNGAGSASDTAAGGTASADRADTGVVDGVGAQVATAGTSAAESVAGVSDSTASHLSTVTAAAGSVTSTVSEGLAATTTALQSSLGG